MGVHPAVQGSPYPEILHRCIDPHPASPFQGGGREHRMDYTLLITQFLNGLQLGVLLFLLASGLSLVFGIMDFVNLAHGSLYMAG